MKKKNGFTLVEMIGAIIILGIISIIAYATYTSSLRGFRDDYYVEVVRTLEQSGKEFFNDNRNYRPQAVLGGQKVSISRLVEEGFIDEIKDYNGKACNNSSYVIVIKEGKDDYSYHVCLVCSEDSYDNTKDNYCNPAWEDPSTVEYGLGTIEPLYVYKGTPRGELREKLKIAISYVKKDYNGNVLGEASGTGFDDVPTIYPTNMDEIDTDKVGEYVLNYEYNGATAKGKVIVYENNEPNFNIKYKSEVAVNLNGLKQLNSGNYNSGEWQQRIFVKVSPNGTIVEPGVTISRYQWNKDGKWQDFCIVQPSGACAPQGEYLQTATDSDMAGYIEIVNDMNETIEFRTVASNGKISRVTTPVIIRRDNTDPTCELKKTGTMGDNSWYTSNVAVEFNNKYDVTNAVSDSKAISGIKTNNITVSTGALNRLSSNTLQTYTEDVAGVEYRGYVEDQAGNFYICKINFKKDGTNPTCVFQLGGTVGDNSWYTSDVDVSFKTHSDNLSGVAQYGINNNMSVQTLTHRDDIGSVTYNGSIKDNAGNTNTCSVTFKKDATQPTCKLALSGIKGSNDWYTSSVTVKFETASDSLSGVAQYGIGNYTNPNTATQQTDTSYVNYTGYIKDNAGNTNTCGIHFKKDGTKPTASWSPAEGTYQNSSGITVTGTCSDKTSGTSSPSVTMNVPSPSSGKSTSITCTDAAGNSETYSSGTYKVQYYYNSNCDKCGCSQYKSCVNDSCATYDCSCKKNQWDECHGYGNYYCDSGTYVGHSSGCTVCEGKSCSKCHYSCEDSSCGCKTCGSCWSF